MSTQLPLSPDEAYEASRLLGRSLFSALQLAREREALQNQNKPSPQDGDVLKIPIPAHLMPGAQQKMAGLGDPPYLNTSEEPQPVPAEGEVSHIKRNLGKYLGSYGGTALGAGIGTGMSLRRNSRGIGSAVGGGAKGAIAGGLLGTGLGALLDNSTKAEHKQKMINSGEFKKKLIQQMYESGELENLLNSGSQFKTAEDFDPSAGIFAKALQMQHHPARLLVGGQQGFRDAKKDYYMMEKANIQKELMAAQKEYIDLLSRIKTGSSEEETPNVDAFCNGIAHMALFGKTASHDDVQIEDDSIKRLAKDMLGIAKKPFSPVSNALTGGLASAGAGAAWLTFLARQQAQRKQEDYLNEQQPTRVELEPY